MNIADAVRDPEFQRQPMHVRAAALKRLGVPDEGVSEYVQKNSSGPSIGSAAPSLNTDPSSFVGDPGEFSGMDVVKGMSKSLGQTARGAIGLVSQKAADTLIPESAVAFDNPTQAKAGQVEQAAELFAPVSKIGKVGALGQAVIEGAKGYGLSKAHGNADSEATAQGALGAAGPLVGSAAQKLAGVLSKSRLKNFINLLQPKNEQQMEEVHKLAQRMGDEGIATPGANWETLTTNADASRKNAGQAVETFLTENADKKIPTKPILDRIDKLAPGKLPGGETPATGRNLHRAFESVRADAEKAMIGAVPKPKEALGRTMNNASGESDASMEAINRLKSMKSQGQKYVIFDRAGNMRPVIGADAVDQGGRLNKGETFGILQADGTFMNLADKGGKVPPRGVGNPAQTAETEAEKLLRWKKLGIVPPPPPKVATPSEIPLRAAVGERRRLDSLLNYDRALPTSAQFVKGSADAYRAGINEAFPDFAKANLRDSELIAISDMLKRAKTLASIPKESNAAGAAGAALVGRSSIPAMYGTRFFAATPQWQTLSAQGKLIASRLLSDTSSASRWLAAAGQTAINSKEGSDGR